MFSKASRVIFFPLDILAILSSFKKGRLNFQTAFDGIRQMPAIQG